MRPERTSRPIRQEGQRQSEALLRDRSLRNFWNGLKELWAGIRDEPACQHGYVEKSLFHWQNSIDDQFTGLRTA